MIPKFPLQEEEEKGGGAGGCYFTSIPTSLTELSEWWKSCTDNICYPLYALVIASCADLDVSTLIRDSREELRIISGKDCCFVYFRELDKAASGDEWSFSEHVKAALPIGQMLGIATPSIVFFEDIGKNKFAIVPLEGLAAYDQLILLRRIFSVFYRLNDSKPLAKIKKASDRIYFKKLAKGVLGKADISVDEFFKLIGKTCFGLVG